MISPPANREISHLVLVVDDDPLLRWAVAQMLRAHGHRSIEVGSVTEALMALHLIPAIDVVCLGCQRADVEGDCGALEALAQLAPHATFILMTVDVDDELQRHVRQHGAHAVLDKPFDVEQVVRALPRARRPE